MAARKSSADAPGPLFRPLHSSRFLQFSDNVKERDFLDRFLQGTLRRWEILSAKLDLFNILLTVLCALSFWSGATVSNWSQFGIQSFDILLQLFVLWGPWLLGNSYYKFRTPVFIFIRLLYSPIRNLHCREKFVSASTEQDGWWFACRILVFFFPYATMFDTVRYPLPLKDHVWVQLMAAGISGLLSGWACERALPLGKDQLFVYNTCSVLSIASTGVGLDCVQAEFNSACSAMALQVQALLSFFPSVMFLHYVEKKRRLVFSEEYDMRPDSHES